MSEHGEGRPRCGDGARVETGARARALAAAALALSLGACSGGSSGRDVVRFDPADAGMDSGPAADADGDAGGPEVGPGPACTADGDCADDGLACTLELCAAGGVCSAHADDSRCDDGLACTRDRCTAAAAAGADGCEHEADDGACAALEPGTRCDPTDGCVPDPAWPCRDGDPCTRDREAGGRCSNPPLDADGDGYSPVSVDGVACAGGDDCDDAEPLVHPLGDEACNGRDDDCDGEIDEGFECHGDTTEPCVTRCGTGGSRRCAGCAWGACEGPTEECNGLDDDCDGTADEGADCGERGVCLGGACLRADLGCVIRTFAGHHYAVCENRLTWDEARGRCEAFGAYLVTVGSAEEQAEVVTWLTTRTWLGLTRQGTCAWHWVNGEPFATGFWALDQPSNPTCGTGQDCVAFWYAPLYAWDDLGCGRTNHYVCEWDG